MYHSLCRMIESNCPRCAYIENPTSSYLVYSPKTCFLPSVWTQLLAPPDNAMGMKAGRRRACTECSLGTFENESWIFQDVLEDTQDVLDGRVFEHGVQMRGELNILRTSGMEARQLTSKHKARPVSTFLLGRDIPADGRYQHRRAKTRLRDNDGFYTSVFWHQDQTDTKSENISKTYMYP